VRLLLVDDDPLVCRSLQTILEADPELQIAGICHDGNEALALYHALLPDILLMDIRMQKVSGLEAAECIIKAHPEARILFLTTFSDTEYIIKALRIGAKGFILKQHFESIIPAIKAVCLGQRVFGDEIVTKIPALLSNGSKDAKRDFKEYHLTEKETEILRRLADGLSNKEIAEKLFLSEGTMRNYISVILEKLALRDRTQLAIFYYKNFFL
jgi:DNA-binding NarL/FixJ family response regulator